MSLRFVLLVSIVGVLVSTLAVFRFWRDFVPLSPAADISIDIDQIPDEERQTGQPQDSLVELPLPPPTASLDGGIHVFQTFNNCGPAALSMALSFYDTFISQQELGQELRPYQRPNGDNDDKSVTLSELQAVAEDLGFIAYHRPSGEIAMIEQFISYGMPVITRTWLRPGEDIGHYRVIKGYDRTQQLLIQDDSLQGKGLAYDYEDFVGLWSAFNYEFLVLVPQEKQELAMAILADHGDEQSAWQLALEHSNQRLMVENGNVYAVFNQAVAHYNLGEYQQAVRAYESVAQKLPGRMLWYQIEPILAYYEVGEDAKALELIDRVFSSQNKAFSELYYLQGRIYERQGRESEAQEAFRQAEYYNVGSYWLENVSGLHGGI